MTTLDATLAGLLEPVLFSEGWELVDVTSSAIGTAAAAVVVLVENLPDHQDGPRIDLDGVGRATLLVDETLEATDPIAGAYTLEVSSPGLERPLRIPAHYQRFIGTPVTVKTVPGTPGERRIEGLLQSADLDADGSIVVEGREIPFSAIERTRTVFVWGGQEKAKSGKAAAWAPKPAKEPKKGSRNAAVATVGAGKIAADNSQTGEKQSGNGQSGVERAGSGQAGDERDSFLQENNKQALSPDVADHQLEGSQ
jgi:ribosome maturation factor RimP